MKLHITTATHRDQNITGYIRLSEFETVNSTLKKISELIRENFDTTSDPEIGIPSVILYYTDTDGDIASILCATTTMHELPVSVLVTEIPCTYVYYVCTLEKYRGQGLCKKLFETLFKICKSNGINRVLIDVDISNIIARGVYDKLGFTSVGSMTDVDGVEHDILALKLDS